MAELSCKRKHRGRIEAAAELKQCIIDGCGCVMKCRGLCQGHANEFFGRKRSMTPDEWVEFENANIEAGLILAPHKQRELTRKSTFVSEAS